MYPAISPRAARKPSVTLAPRPALAFTEAGALALLGEWGVPLVSLLALRIAHAVDALESDLWANGPTAGEVLHAANLIAAPTGEPVLRWPLPAPDALALGALRKLADGVTVPVGDLRVSVVDDGQGRTGLRLHGPQPITDTVSVHFGDASWLDDPDDPCVPEGADIMHSGG